MSNNEHEDNCPEGLNSPGGNAGPSNTETSSQEGFTGSYVAEAYSRIPDLGKGKRWYDPPYAVLDRILRSRLWKHLPAPLKRAALYGTNYLIPFHQHDLHKVWSSDDPLHNVFVPDNDRVRLPGIWVVEMFPPSEYDTLVSAIREHRWDKQDRLSGFGTDIHDRLERSRTGSVAGWWWVGHIIDERAPFTHPDARKEKLPTYLHAIELQAVQVGPGLTALVAHFRVDPAGARLLDDTWHTDHPPELVRGKGRPRPDDRMWTTFRKTQEARRSIHDSCRQWLATAYPGLFTRYSKPQPLIDLLLLEAYDPLAGKRPDRMLSDALRAVGITNEISHITSPELPGLLLDSVDTFLCPSLGKGRIWSLWGNRARVSESIEKLASYGGEEEDAIRYVTNETMRVFFVRLAISETLDMVRQEQSRLRDTARAKQGRFRGQALKDLRETFLTLSLDLNSIARAIETFNDSKSGLADEPRFMIEDAPWISENRTAGAGQSRDPFDFLEHLKGTQKQVSEELVASDDAYRGILSTVTTLGASVDAFRLGRIAIVIAVVSLLVACVTLIFIVANQSESDVSGVTYGWSEICLRWALQRSNCGIVARMM